jgi:hypothetical protein
MDRRKMPALMDASTEARPSQTRATTRDEAHGCIRLFRASAAHPPLPLLGNLRQWRIAEEEAV